MIKKRPRFTTIVVLQEVQSLVYVQTSTEICICIDRELNGHIKNSITNLNVIFLRELLGLLKIEKRYSLKHCPLLHYYAELYHSIKISMAALRKNLAVK